ncbi:acetylxylan esterase [Streptococcus sanguinis]
MKNPTLLKEMLHYRGRDEMPSDFDTFWNQHVAEVC